MSQLTKAKPRKNLAQDNDLAKWCQALSCTRAEDTVPKGWHTSRELCALLGKSSSRVNEMLTDAIHAGRCEQKDFRIAAAGTVRPVPHYKLVGK